jgi:hypothetical protein
MENDIKSAAALLGRKGGSKTSERKARSSAENGRKGGSAATMTPQARAFADACIAQNATDELQAALAGPADKTDCKTWRITPAQWRLAIRTALAEMRNV